LGYNFTGDGSISETTTTPNPYRKPLFVTEPFTFVGISGDRIELYKDKKVFSSVPISRVSEVLLLEKSSVSSQFIKDVSITIYQSHLPSIQAIISPQSSQIQEPTLIWLQSIPIGIINFLKQKG